MATQHFAGVDSNDTVIAILVVADEDTTDPDTGLIDPAIGAQHLLDLMPSDSDIVEFIHTDPDGAFRHRYAHTGGIYYRNDDVFIRPQPFSDWVLNLTTYEWEEPPPP